MQSLTFVLEATLLAPLVEFATSSSGHIEPRQGLALGWLGSVVAGLAVVFGTADRGQADSCYGISEGDSGWVCSSDVCKRSHSGVPLLGWKYLYSHDVDEGCGKTGVKSCGCPMP
jgi:hypothetical protein